MEEGRRPSDAGHLINSRFTDWANRGRQFGAVFYRRTIRFERRRTSPNPTAIIGANDNPP